MRLAFAGTPEFARVALASLLDAGHEVVAVLSQPDRPSGRGLRLQASPVKAFATRSSLPMLQPRGLRLDGRFAEDALAAQSALAAAAPEAIVVAAYGLILPGWLLALPSRGCINIHASLLPRWRGAAPIPAAILAGDAETGVTIMRMDEGLDTGPILLRAAVPITPATTASELHDRLAALGAGLILRTLAENPPAVPQPEAATFAPKLRREDGRIDWSRDADAIARQVRALNPWPGTFTTFGKSTLKILAARPAPGSGAPGMVLDEDFTVACGRDALRPSRVQLAGRPAMDADAFLRGHRVPPGTRLG